MGSWIPAAKHAGSRGRVGGAGAQARRGGLRETVRGEGLVGRGPQRTGTCARLRARGRRVRGHLVVPTGALGTPPLTDRREAPGERRRARILDMGIDTFTSHGRLVLTLIGGIVQWEREVMLE